MAERNIWQEKGCCLPGNRGICNICCTTCHFVATLSSGETFFNHPDKPCPFQNTEDTQSGGCNIYLERPQTCRGFHCSQESDEAKIRLILAAKNVGLVTMVETDSALSQFSREQVSEVVCRTLH